MLNIRSSSRRFGIQINKNYFSLVWILACAGMTILFSACQPISITNATLTLSNHTFTVEIADSPAEREKGLMFRENLCDSCGMLFIYSKPQTVSFWMKNTFIPLDILYFDAEFNLRQILPDVPICQPVHPPMPAETKEKCPVSPSRSDQIQYVLELPAGTAKQIEAKINDKLKVLK